jgi:cellulose 1,4-beta-cellobiosidase
MFIVPLWSAYMTPLPTRIEQRLIGIIVLKERVGGASGGEFSSANGGLDLYKKTFVDPYAAALKAAWDLTFAVILEPDSLGNVITKQAVPFCANATSTYEQGIVYAIAKLQAPNIALYIDAAYGGWLGWDANLEPGT